MRVERGDEDEGEELLRSSSERGTTSGDQSPMKSADRLNINGEIGDEEDPPVSSSSSPYFVGRRRHVDLDPPTGGEALGDPPEWALLLLGCLLGLATGLCVAAFNRGVHVIHEWAWAGTPNEGAAWLRLQRLADTWHRVLLIPVTGGVIVGMMHGLLEILDHSKSSQRHGFNVLAGIFPTIKAIQAAVTLGTGCSLGPEGPSVDIGKSCANGCYLMMENNRQRNIALVAAGAAAGIASAASSVCISTSGVGSTSPGLNMAEALAQASPHSNNVQQVSLQTQRDELAVTQSRILIPMTPKTLDLPILLPRSYDVVIDKGCFDCLSICAGDAKSDEICHQYLLRVKELLRNRGKFICLTRLYLEDSIGWKVTVQAVFPQEDGEKAVMLIVERCSGLVHDIVQVDKSLSHEVKKENKLRDKYRKRAKSKEDFERYLRDQGAESCCEVDHILPESGGDYRIIALTNDMFHDVRNVDVLWVPEDQLVLHSDALTNSNNWQLEHFFSAMTEASAMLFIDLKPLLETIDLKIQVARLNMWSKEHQNKLMEIDFLPRPQSSKPTHQIKAYISSFNVYFSNFKSYFSKFVFQEGNVGNHQREKKNLLKKMIIRMGKI